MNKCINGDCCYFQNDIFQCIKLKKNPPDTCPFSQVTKDQQDKVIIEILKFTNSDKKNVIDFVKASRFAERLYEILNIIS
jgi:hypothetical protein